MLGFWDAVASAGPYANDLHLDPERWPHQHLITQFLQTGCSSWRPTNSFKALKALGHNTKWQLDRFSHFCKAHNCFQHTHTHTQRQQNISNNRLNLTLCIAMPLNNTLSLCTHRHCSRLVSRTETLTTRGKVLSWEYRSPRKRNSCPSATPTIFNAHSPQHAFL